MGARFGAISAGGTPALQQVIINLSMAETITWLWLIVGLALIATELFLPGFVVVFLGIAAILVACFRWMGLLSGLVESFTVWFITSMVLLIGLRHFAMKWFPSETSYQMTDEDVEAIGTIVEVIDTVGNSDQKGRIRFAGTSWPAVTREGSISAGTKAKLLYRDNLVWTVEPYHQLESAKETE